MIPNRLPPSSQLNKNQLYAQRQLDQMQKALHNFTPKTVRQESVRPTRPVADHKNSQPISEFNPSGIHGKSLASDATTDDYFKLIGKYCFANKTKMAPTTNTQQEHKLSSNNSEPTHRQLWDKSQLNILDFKKDQEQFLSSNTHEPTHRQLWDKTRLNTLGFKRGKNQ